MMKVKKIYLLSETDKWREDYDPKEAYLTKKYAEKRLIELNNGVSEITNQTVFHVMDEIPLMDMVEK